MLFVSIFISYSYNKWKVKLQSFIFFFNYLNFLFIILNFLSNFWKYIFILYLYYINIINKLNNLLIFNKFNITIFNNYFKYKSKI